MLAQCTYLVGLCRPGCGGFAWSVLVYCRYTHIVSKDRIIIAHVLLGKGTAKAQALSLVGWMAH